MISRRAGPHRLIVAIAALSRDPRSPMLTIVFRSVTRNTIVLIDWRVHEIGAQRYVAVLTIKRFVRAHQLKTG